MTIARPVLSLKHFLEITANADPFPFYAALLYAPADGLDGKLHQYVAGHWEMLNRLTGDSCLLMALEDRDGKDIAQFKPEEIYDIVRHLGVAVESLPCLVFFVDPRTQRDTLTIRLREFLGPSAGVDDEGLTDFFRGVQSIVDACAESATSERLECLRHGLDHTWPKDNPWADKLTQAGGWLVSSATAASTIVAALTAIRGLFGLP